ncbi:MAG TPA: hypothetical protein PLV39_14760 [Fimbriimonadaceae bacterium]|jgi:DNA-binding NarL/FixJ family response regulator|nr:hypothetical protein [Fimbriimonadaceae bacterium]
MSEGALPDCLSLQACTNLDEVRSQTIAKRKAAKEEVARLVSERLSATIVEIRLDVLSDLLNLAAEGQEARDRRTQRAAARKKLGSNASKSTTLPPAVLELARAGKSPKEIVAELGLPATYIGPIGARLKVARERGEL